ncbi:MAG TPA: alpha/beta fold hydrolase [Candidatus Binatus sp.]|nr:alpha/beta fold hydrolase [Candidatus Binatus sp.]
MIVRPADELERGVRARSARLYTRDAGSGQAVLLLHAFPLNSRMWEPQLAVLAGGCRLIVPDMPGFGLSPAPATTPSLDDWARAVVAVLAALDVDRVIVAGLSMGGYLAFRLIEPLGPRLIGMLLADTRATPDTEDAAVRRHELAAEVEMSGVEAAAAEFLPKLLGRTTQRTRPELLDRVRAIILENTPAGVAGALRAMAARPDSTPLLARIRCPVLCLAGDEDVVTPPDVVGAMAEQIPGARMRTVPLAGHLTSVEVPEAFNDAVGELLDRSVRR